MHTMILEVAPLQIRAGQSAAFEAARERPSVRLLAGQSVERVHVDAEAVELRLAGTPPLHAQLLVAADSRFSEIRRALGIPTRMHDFGILDFDRAAEAIEEGRRAVAQAIAVLERGEG